MEIASLTKIITCFLTIRLCWRLSIDTNIHKIAISKNSEKTTGTSANLKFGQIYTINDLLYGLMLPSGNDAAVSLAEGVGWMLKMEESNGIEQIQ